MIASARRLRGVLGMTLILQLLLAGCSGGDGDLGTGTPTAPTASTVAGRWTGRASGIETADFTFVLGQAGTSVTGTGDVFFPGDQNRFAFDVTDP